MICSCESDFRSDTLICLTVECTALGVPEEDVSTLELIEYTYWCLTGIGSWLIYAHILCAESYLLGWESRSRDAECCHLWGNSDFCTLSCDGCLECLYICLEFSESELHLEIGDDEWHRHMLWKTLRDGVCVFFMVPGGGIEPTTLSLEGFCSSTELPGQVQRG